MNKLITFCKKYNIRYTLHRSLVYNNVPLVYPPKLDCGFFFNLTNTVVIEESELYTHIYMDLKDIHIYKKKKEDEIVEYNDFDEEIINSNTPKYEDTEYYYYFVKSNVKYTNVNMSKWSSLHTNTMLIPVNDKCLFHNEENEIYKYEFTNSFNILHAIIDNHKVIDFRYSSNMSNSIPVHPEHINEHSDILNVLYVESNCLCTNSTVYKGKKNNAFIRSTRDKLLKESDILMLDDYSSIYNYEKHDIYNYRKYLRDITDDMAPYKNTYLPINLTDYIQFSNVYNDLIIGSSNIKLYQAESFQ